MLFLLRKIRHSLLNTNKIVTYVFYAIGEIVLVVVGILIAVQIGNKNEEQKERLVQAEYIRNLKEDLIADTVNLSAIRTIAQRNVNSIERYEEYFKNGKWTLKELVDSAINTNLNYHLYFPNNTTFDEMKSAGDLRLLSTSIKRSLNETRLSQNLLAMITDNLVKRADQLKIEGAKNYYRNKIEDHHQDLAGNLNEYKLKEALKFRHMVFEQFRDSERIVRLIGIVIIRNSKEVITKLDEELTRLEKLK